MNFLKDRQIKRYWLFLCGSVLFLFLAGMCIVRLQVRSVQSIMLSHDNAVVTSLMEQGISKSVIATAISSTQDSENGQQFLSLIGRTRQTQPRYFPLISRFFLTSQGMMLFVSILIGCVLLTGTFIFFNKREKLYQQADEIITAFTKGDFQTHLPGTDEGALSRLFSSVDRLATMLSARNETDDKTKEFLRETISDISHQLKTPLSALTMYQEIIEEESDHPETVKEFSRKMNISLNRIKQLISNMLKITRLDAGSITFHQEKCQTREFILQAISELTMRAEKEKKKIILSGREEDSILCDPIWTGEAIGNLVKNALDHTEEGGMIKITWENSPYVNQIKISDNGHGILPEDIHHIFKRFYRSKNALDTQGAGLGLSLAKSIVEGQGGTITVYSERNKGTTFSISMLTKL